MKEMGEKGDPYTTPLPDDEETDFGGHDDNFSKDNDRFNEIDDVSEVEQKDDDWEMGKFNEEYFIEKRVVTLFNLLELETECADPNFVKWLVDTKMFKITHRNNMDFSFEYYGGVVNGAPTYRVEKINNGFINDQTRYRIADEIRGYYDEYSRIETDKTLKKAGIMTAVGVTIVSLITGLSLGLKRKGTDMVFDAKTKLKPAKKLSPWAELEKAAGEGLIIIGDNIFVVIAGVVIYKILKK